MIVQRESGRRGGRLAGSPALCSVLHVFFNLCSSYKAEFFVVAALDDVSSLSDVIGGFVLYVLAK